MKYIRILLLITLALSFTAGCGLNLRGACLDRIAKRQIYPIAESISHTAYKDKDNNIFMHFKFPDGSTYIINDARFSKIQIADGEAEHISRIYGEEIKLEKKHISKELMKITYSDKIETVDIRYRKGSAWAIPFYVVILPIATALDFVSSWKEFS